MLVWPGKKSEEKFNVEYFIEQMMMNELTHKPNPLHFRRLAAKNAVLECVPVDLLSEMDIFSPIILV